MPGLPALYHISWHCHLQLYVCKDCQEHPAEIMPRFLPKLCNQSGQIMVAVDRGERPEMPAAHQLLGGGFVGLPHYQRLMHACWAVVPHERPPMEEVLTLPVSKHKWTQLCKPC